MAPQGNDVGSRVEGLLAQLRRQGGDPAADTGEELVRLLVSFYGEGLAAIVGILGRESPGLLLRIAEDPLVGSQLILHGVHPVGLDERIEQALDQARPYLGSHAGGVAYLGVDDDGIAHLRLDGSCKNCPSSTLTVRTTITDAVLAAAPELVGIEVEGKAEEPKPLLQIGLRPGLAPPPAAAVSPPVAASVWLHPSRNELPADGEAGLVRLDGRHVLMARLGETYVAYADSCASCGGSLAGGPLAGDVLGCGSCGSRFDVRLAGRAVDRSGLFLHPLPLLDDTSGIRIALVPEAV